MKSKNNNFVNLCHTIKTLRSNNGCDWDKNQDTQTLKKYIKEEIEELFDAIDNNDPSHLCEEIGDVMFLLVLLSQINSEAASFTIDDVIKNANDKMIRRHPHVFSNGPRGDADFHKEQWEKIKIQEQLKK